MSSLPYLPIELWECILDMLDTPGLLGFQQACQEWHDILINYVMSGRLKNRALVSIKYRNLNKMFE